MTKFGSSRVKLSDIDNFINVLLGPNGSGKSMSLLELEDEINEKYNDGYSFDSSLNPFTKIFNSEHKINVPVYKFKSSSEDVVIHHNNFDPSRLSAAFTSEGERMNTSLDFWLSDIFLKSFGEDKPKKFYILLDELDSGLSLDRIQIIIEYMFSLLHNMKYDLGIDIQIVVTANSYELLHTLLNNFGNKVSVFWVPSRKKIEIQSYEDFRKLYQSRYRYYLKEIKGGADNE